MSYQTSTAKMKTEKELLDLMRENPTKLLNLCRICLCDGICNPIALFSADEDISSDKQNADSKMDLREQMVMCGHVKIDKGDGLPKSICALCNHDLNSANQFRIRCQQADMLLRKVLNECLESDGRTVEKAQYDLKSEIDISDIKVEAVEVDIHNDEYFDSEESNEVLIKIKKKRNKKDISKRNVNGKQLSILDELKQESGLSSHIENKVNAGESAEDDEEEQHICDICNKRVKTKYILAKHMKVLHGEDRGFRKKRAEIGPVTGHGADRRFHCPECDYKCRRRQTLQYHMSTHTGEKPFKCDECPRSFAQHASLYTHRKTHSDKTYYTCQECGRQFKHYGIFKNHKKVHSNEFNFACTICNKAMKTQKTLNDHMNRHLQIKRYSCEYCGRSFVTQSCLILHLRTHNKEKERKYKCSYCEFSFHSKGALDIHIKRHTGVRNFPCELCNHMCYTRGELKTHSRKHTKEQNYACPLCDMKFRHSPSLNKHMLKKHGEKFKWSTTVDRRIVK